MRPSKRQKRRKELISWAPFHLSYAQQFTYKWNNYHLHSVIPEIRLLLSLSFLVFLISRMSLKFLAALIPLICFTHASSKKIPLVIGGVFDIDTKLGDENSASMIPIVRMAIKHVNECPKTLVNYELQMEVKDVKVGNTINLKDSRCS